MTEKTLTTENIKPALDALRGELAPWPVVAKKQDRLNTAQLNAANSGITSSLVAQIIANTAAIRALESAITGTGLRALVVSSLPAVGTTGILYIVPVTTYDPETDADVVNYSNEYIWIPVEGGQASEGHYEQVGQTGIVINNGQLTITVNGTSVGTFTANQSGDTTAAITVPTNADYVDKTTAQSITGVKTFSDGIVSNVTGNVTGDLTGTASKAIADEDGTSIKTGYVNVAGNQTVTGDKSFTGSNTFNNILPNAANTYSLGTSSYQWSSVYAQTYYYNGTAWGLDKANVWTGNNTYTKYQNIIIAGTEIGVAPNNQNRNGLLFQDKNNETLGWIRSAYDPSGDLSIEMLVSNKYSNGALDPNGTQIYQGIKQTLTASGDSYFSWSGKLNTNVVPRTHNSFDLGTSTNKWKTLNGVNPGILSFPRNISSERVNIDTTNWDFTGTTWNTMNTSTIIDGWACFGFSNCGANDFIVIRRANTGIDRPTQSATPILDPTVSKYYLFIVFPIIKNTNLYVKINTSGTLAAATVYPCVGNV